MGDLQISGKAPAQMDTFDGVLESCREATLQDGESLESVTDRAEFDVEVAALKALMQALHTEEARLDKSLSNLTACDSFRKNRQALLGSWSTFAKRAPSLLVDKEFPEEASTSAEPYILHARLYFGLWMRSAGQRLAYRNSIAVETIQSALDFGSITYFDTLLDN